MWVAVLKEKLIILIRQGHYENEEIRSCLIFTANLTYPTGSVTDQTGR